MAIYEYECKACKITFEVLDFKNEGKDKPCPKCKSLCKKVEISKSNFQLGKNGGVGWHKDGYAARRSVAKSPGGEREKRGSNRAVPVRQSKYSLEPNKDTSKKKRPKLKVM
jgi:putative FmdB family regulatory protein